MIPYSRQKISSNDIKAVNKVLKSKFLTTGPKVIEFENKLSRVFKSKYALSANSATSALHLACLSLGLKQNDYLWTSSISFVASANCALYCGAKVDFVDIDPETLNMSIKDLERRDSLNIEIQSNLESQIKDYKLMVFNDSLMIFQLENQVKLKNDLIKEIEPKWYENKYLWFWYGALIMWLIK